MVVRGITLGVGFGGNNVFRLVGSQAVHASPSGRGKVYEQN
jgi:hypothetical protein